MGSFFQKKLEVDFSEGEIKKFIDIKFNIYDKNKSNFLEFEEFVNFLNDIQTSCLDYFLYQNNDEKAFKLCDKQKRNKVSREDVIPLVNEITQGIENQKVYETLKRLLKEGQKSREEFQKEIEDPELIKYFFKLYDKNNSGYLEITEYAYFIAELGLKYFAHLVKYEYDSEKFFYKYDLDKDDKISYEEFIPLYKDLLYGRYEIGYIGFTNQIIKNEFENLNNIFFLKLFK